MLSLLAELAERIHLVKAAISELSRSLEIVEDDRSKEAVRHDIAIKEFTLDLLEEEWKIEMSKWI